MATGDDLELGTTNSANSTTHLAANVAHAIAFLVTLVFPWQLQTLGSSATFLIYGLFALVGLVFVMRILPETKGRSLEELEAALVKA